MHTFPSFFAGAFGLGGGELILILAVLLLLFGGSKLPELAKGLGQSMKEFKRASQDDPEPTRSAPAAAKPTATTTPTGTSASERSPHSSN